MARVQQNNYTGATSVNAKYGRRRDVIDSKIINQTFEKFSFANGVFKGFFSTCYFEYNQFWEHFDKNKYS